MRGLAITTLTAVAVLSAAPAAGAHGVITRDGSVLTYTASNNCQPSPCPSSLVVTTPETGVLKFEDHTSKGGIFWGPCDPVDEEITTCDSSGITRIDVVFDHNNDSASMGTAIPVRVTGGDGNDEITGGYGADVLDGGPGGDIVVGGPGADSVLGGDGDDTIDVRDGVADAADCGPGTDSVSIDQLDPSPVGCETISTEDTPPPAGPPDTPPHTTIKKSPKRETKKDKAKFKFKATEPDSRYECSLDASPYRPCKSPKVYEQLKPGRHKFKVRATDAAGNTEPTPAKYDWKVER